MTKQIKIAISASTASVVLAMAGMAFAQTQPVLKDVFKGAFLIGAAVNPAQFYEHRFVVKYTYSFRP